MVFSSIEFLYYFLPIVLLFYFIVPFKFKNLVLFVASIFFYFYGEPRYVIVLLFSCLFNYLYSHWLDKSKNKKLMLIINLIINFSFLFYFKYCNFFLDNINSVLNTSFHISNIIMPIGISFFTFQSTSYVIDVYWGKVKPAKTFLTFASYLSLFPQLIAGPIVRYETVEAELYERKHSFESFYKGMKRLIIGLGKKVLLANILGEFSKALANLATKTVLSFWLKAFSDSMQLYFDFSGYSDMAIGLGLIFGFHFLENFNYPFIADSITNFWHRWHISLSTWFKDYVYIPLGGSRVGEVRRYVNIFIVWMLTGFWHGADWNFILWGLYFAFFLIIEKKFFLGFLKKHKVFSHVYTVILVVLGFVIFNETNLVSIVSTFKNIFFLGGIPFTNLETMYYFNNYMVVFIVSMVLSTPVIKYINNKLKLNERFEMLEGIVYIALFIVITAYIVDASFNPFLYFRF